VGSQSSCFISPDYLPPTPTDPGFAVKSCCHANFQRFLARWGFREGQVSPLRNIFCGQGWRWLASPELGVLDNLLRDELLT
jgi:hypothetical protein